MHRKQIIIHKTMAAEGGYADNPKLIDQPTYIGITQPTLDKHNADHPALNFPTLVKDLSPTQAYQIYAEYYYDKRKIGEIENTRIANAVFDMGVMSNFKNVVKMIQRTLNNVFNTTLVIDGVMGLHTIHALNAIPAPQVDRFMATLKIMRLEYLRGLPGWTKFGNGWTRRTNRY